MAKSISGVTCFHFSRRKWSSVGATYWSKSCSSVVATFWSPIVSTHVVTNGLQPMSDSLRKMTPARETVAGEALRRSSTSKPSVTFGRSIGMRSLLASVRMRLSSITVLRFSIQIASTGPSSMSQVKFLRSLLALRHSCAKMPSVHSLAITSRQPNICGAVIALGFMRSSRCGWPTIGGRFWSALTSISDLWSVSTMRDLPTPDGPTCMMEWRTRHIS
mmetsp:Transcript_25452/g.58911  ORF Transcript_25452/g.58911 Transcript_25452/m.58911 type:complete len:218 (-) Transcript_25452:3345-3998(-)